VRRYHWLAVVPAACMLGGIPFANRVRPFVFGLPFLLAWIVAWIIMTSLTMALIFLLDSRREVDAADATTPGDHSTPR
jgi:uncharacterized protein DUF3311